MVAVSGYQRWRGTLVAGSGGYWCGRTWQTPYCSAPVRARLPASLMTSPFLTLFNLKSYMDLRRAMWHSVITPNYRAICPSEGKAAATIRTDPSLRSHVIGGHENRQEKSVRPNVFTTTCDICKRQRSMRTHRKEMWKSVGGSWHSCGKHDGRRDLFCEGDLAVCALNGMFAGSRSTAARRQQTGTGRAETINQRSGQNGGNLLLKWMKADPRAFLGLLVHIGFTQSDASPE